jgi:YtkA-like
MQRVRTWISLGFVLALVLSGCARGGQELPDVGVDVAVTPSPPQLGPATITVTLRDSGGQPITGARVELEGNMNHAGMVPVLVRASEMAPGQYQASLEFGMGGDWFILVRADLPNGRSTEHRVDLPGVGDIRGDTPVP